MTCASTACHGGADEKSRQFVIWSQRDAHSRSFATLATARAARMAEALGIQNPVMDARCTTCHAPLQTVPAETLAANARIGEGVSCVSCHGTGDGWLRGHTRPDYTHAERVGLGLRELRDLSARANACVACHQNLDPQLVTVGKHPALLFELDGQTQAQPKHWREPAGRTGAQAWFVGQAVAWREISWALENQAGNVARDLPRWQALRWLLQRTGLAFELSSLEHLGADASASTLARAREAADQLAQRAARAWPAEHGISALVRLAATAGDFQDARETALVQACRAERLVLALDRLVASRPNLRASTATSAQLDKLFRLAQSIPDFVPADFARELAGFAQTLEALP